MKQNNGREEEDKSSQKNGCVLKKAARAEERAGCKKTFCKTGRKTEGNKASEDRGQAVSCRQENRFKGNGAKEEDSEIRKES
jgi:hypothetical protein